MSIRDWFSTETRKYELVRDQQIVADSTTLYRIRALKSFGKVKAGDLGGFIGSERNLSQDGQCWVSDEARVYGTAYVSDNAQVSDHARVFDNARVSGDALVFEKSRIYGDAQLHDKATVCGEGQVFEKASVYGDSIICDHSLVCGDALVYGETLISGHAQVFDQAQVSGETVSGETKIRGNIGREPIGSLTPRSPHIKPR
jgi:carbonic anhydrase/acetyltransferase-like protein (isoleucine patch superfamily)